MPSHSTTDFSVALLILSIPKSKTLVCSLVQRGFEPQLHLLSQEGEAGAEAAGEKAGGAGTPRGKSFLPPARAALCDQHGVGLWNSPRAHK